MLVNGAVLGTGLELAHEVAENSEYIINLYRRSSGTSQLYMGDSVQNIGEILFRIYTGCSENISKF